MNNQVITEVESHKHLGVTFKSSGTLHKHIQLINTKTNVSPAAFIKGENNSMMLLSLNRWRSHANAFEKIPTRNSIAQT